MEEMRERAFSQYKNGNIETAIQQQINIINLQMAATNAAEIRDYKRLGFYYVNNGDSEAAVNLFSDLKQELPNDVDLLARLGLCLTNIKKYDEAIIELEKVLKVDATNDIALDAITRSCTALGRVDDAKRYGKRSILAKDVQACKSGIKFAIPDKTPDRFDFANPAENIISFSLWGDNPRYIKGAVRNARLAQDIYPGWVCRFYCDDSVDARCIAELKKYNAEIVFKPAPTNLYEGLFWRFEVLSDDKVKRFLVRDCDSVINSRERIAVEEWLNSDKYFHIMRDYYSHTDLIFAGMWGGVGGIFPPLDDLVQEMNKQLMPTRIMDQVFLRGYVWPTLKQSVLIHDSKFDIEGCMDFPALGFLAPNRHVGQDEYTVLREK